MDQGCVYCVVETEEKRRERPQKGNLEHSQGEYAIERQSDDDGFASPRSLSLFCGLSRLFIPSQLSIPMLETTAEVACPYCGETITLFLDLSVESQTYIEDCSVCCQPMSVSYTVEDGELAGVTVESAN